MPEGKEEEGAAEVTVQGTIRQNLRNCAIAICVDRIQNTQELGRNAGHHNLDNGCAWIVNMLKRPYTAFLLAKTT